MQRVIVMRQYVKQCSKETLLFIRSTKLLIGHYVVSWMSHLYHNAPHQLLYLYQFTSNLIYSFFHRFCYVVNVSVLCLDRSECGQRCNANQILHSHAGKMLPLQKIQDKDKRRVYNSRVTDPLGLAWLQSRICHLLLHIQLACLIQYRLTSLKA